MSINKHTSNSMWHTIHQGEDLFEHFLRDMANLHSVLRNEN
jgi:hypothetical protein